MVNIKREGCITTPVLPYFLSIDKNTGPMITSTKTQTLPLIPVTWQIKLPVVPDNRSGLNIINGRSFGFHRERNLDGRGAFWKPLLKPALNQPNVIDILNKAPATVQIFPIGSHKERSWIFWPGR